MYRHHGQKRQECTGKHHTEHIPKIGTGSHLYVLIDIAECLSSFKHSIFQYHQIFFQQDNICAFFGYIHSRID